MTDAARITQLKGELELAHARVREVQDALNALRVKCPGCRCHILPGDECQCCAGTQALNNSMEPWV